MRFLTYFLLFIFVIVAGSSLLYVVTRTLTPSGATDFHSYWYAGQFLRQGIDPYTAFLYGLTPHTPVLFLDKTGGQNLPLAQPGLARVPANTAPMVELLTIFSFFSWPTAKFLWMVCNLALIFVIPFLILRLFPLLNKRPVIDRLFFVLIFIGLFGTRNVAGNGQTSLLVFMLMLLAILAKERNWLPAGIAMGLALSKYSLALPLLLLFLMERKYRQIIVGLSIQVAAVVFLSAVTRQPIIQILVAYFRIFQFHTDQPGIQLASLLPAGSLASWVAVIILSLVVAGFLLFWLYKKKRVLSSEANPFVKQVIFTILMMWALLVAYHRAYDTFVSILFISLTAEWLIKTGGSFQRQRWFLGILAGFAIVIMTLPARGISVIEQRTTSGFTAIWLRLQSSSITITLIAILVCSIWILYRLKPVTGSEQA